MATAGPSVPSADASEGRRRCAGCGHAYRLQNWKTLRLCDELSPERLGTFVTHWPAGASVEVRVCDHCGKPMARLRHSL